jgi:hypothetical protein
MKSPKTLATALAAAGFVSALGLAYAQSDDLQQRGSDTRTTVDQVNRDADYQQRQQMPTHPAVDPSLQQQTQQPQTNDTTQLPPTPTDTSRSSSTTTSPATRDMSSTTPSTTSSDITSSTGSSSSSYPQNAQNGPTTVQSSGPERAPQADRN